MPVRGLVVTLSNNAEKATSALSRLSDRAEIDLGECNDRYLPLVISTETEDEGREVISWIESVEGIYFVDTVFSSVERAEQVRRQTTR